MEMRRKLLKLQATQFKETMIFDGSNQQVTTSHHVCQYLYDH